MSNPHYSIHESPPVTGASRYLPRFLKKIGAMGVRPDMDSKLARNVAICNYAACSHAFLTFPYYWVFRMIGAGWLADMVIPLTLFFASIPVMNRAGWITLSRVGLVTAINLNVYMYTACLGMDTAIQNVFFFTLIAPLMLFHVSEWRTILICVAQPIVLWALLFAKGAWFIPPIHLEPWAYKVFAPAITTTTAIMLFACSFLISISHQISEKRLVDAKESAERSNLAKSQFLATMSHEIRTPMNGLFGTLQLLMSSNLSPQQAGHLNLMKSSGELLLTIIDDILDFSKIESGKLELESRVFNIRETMETSLRLVEQHVRGKSIALSCHVGEGCPQTVLGDETRYRQVLMNLLNNAVKFTPSGSITLSLSRTGGSDEEPEMTLTVRDTGIGIPSDKLDKLFLAFSQVDSSTTRKYGGTGLGLAISKRLALHMGGDLRVESVEGQGSAFHFTSRHSMGPQVTPREPPVPPRGTGRFAGKTALVVEDNRINQIVAGELLSVLGFRVEVADNGAAALEMVKRKGFDVIFMDCQMPVMDGYAATAAIRKLVDPMARGKSHLIIAMTANSMSEDRDRCLDAGMNDFIAKPILLGPLGSLLDAHFSGEGQPARS